MAVRQDYIDELQLIDKLGVVTPKQFISFTGRSQSNAYFVLGKLLERGLVQKMETPFLQVYYITATGSSYSGVVNRAFVKGTKEPNLAILRHAIIINEVILNMQNVYAESGKAFSWETERQLLHEAIIFGEIQRNKQPLIPDLKITVNDERVVVEVELTPKAVPKVTRKLTKYKSQIENDEFDTVWYIYENQAVKSAVLRARVKSGLENYQENKLSDIVSADAQY